VLQAVIQQTDGLRICALLRAEYSRRAVFPTQGIVNVAHGNDLRLPQPGHKSVCADAGDAVQGPAHGDKGPVRLVQEFNTQGRRRAAAAVVGGAAAQAQDDPLCAALQSVGHQLPDAVCGGVRRPAVIAYQGQARRRSHFYHGSAAVRQKAVAGGDGPAIGIPAGNRDFFSAQGGQEGVHRALSAVRHGNGADLRLRLQGPDLSAQDAAYLPRGQGALEGIRDQNVLAHSVPSWCYLPLIAASLRLL